jgi:omega-amidase
MEVKENLEVALVQIDMVWESVDINLMKIERFIEELDKKPDLVILPEAFNTGFSIHSQNLAEPADGKTIQWMKDLSARKDFALCGSLFIKDGLNYYNRFIWVEPDGKLYGYDKRHLFSMGEEDKLFSQGKTQLIINYKGWKIFPTICYDLRFPVWNRNVHSYDLLINVANWPAARKKVWKTLLKARAIENQCYVVAVNRVGVDGNQIEYSGNSTVIDAKGIKLLKGKHFEQISIVSLSYSALYNFRKKFDTLSDADRFNLLM